MVKRHNVLTGLDAGTSDEVRYHVTVAMVTPPIIAITTGCH